MSVSEPLENLFVGRVTFPVTSYLFNRRGILANYRQMVKSEHLPQEKLQAIQLEKLKRLVDYANRHCPFYTRRFKELGLVPGDIKTLEDFRLIPPLTREELKQNRLEMVDVRYADSVAAAEASTRGPGQPIAMGRFRKAKLVKNTSSGSTGSPVVFYEDGSMTAMNWAFELRLRKWYGLDPGVREARMARVSADYLPNAKLIWARKWLWHQLILPGVNLGDAEYALCLDMLREFRPKVLWGFTSALAGLAEYIRRTGQDLGPFRPHLLIGWAAPLYDHEDKLLKEVFQCWVTNIYGAREVGHIAAYCPERSWHINQEHVLLETTDSSDVTPGEILVTPLNLSPMPFLRYRLGDLGTTAISDCGCGRTLQVMKNFLGRTGEIFVTKDGRMIAPNFWCRTFMVGRQSRTVERFQIVYRRDDLVSIRIVRKPDYTPETEADIRGILEKNFRSDVRFEFEYVPRIEPQISGKYQMVINEATTRRH